MTPPCFAEIWTLPKGGHMRPVNSSLEIVHPECPQIGAKLGPDLDTFFRQENHFFTQFQEKNDMNFL